MIIYGNNNHVYGQAGTYFGIAAPPVYYLTLQTDGHGTMSASVLSGYSGDTVTLSNTYNTYYRFNNYTVTGGTIVGSTFTFGDSDATAQANFKVNYFTATGNFEKGSNVGATGNAVNVPAKYAVRVASTGSIPASWYSTSNRWKPNGASAYSITLKPVMKFTATTNGYQSYTAAHCYATAVSLIGSTQTQSQSFSKTGTGWKTTAFTYSKSFTNTTQNVNYGISAKILGGHNATFNTNITYVATATTGTWTATGIAP